MNDFLKSALREIAQKVVGAAVVWLVAHGFEVPEAVTNWTILTLVGAGLALWTIVVRFLETRDSGFARGLARLLMLGIASKPTYVQPTPEAVKAVRGY